MANQEVVNAINETMVPNGVKAINADSVRNLLLLMAEKMGEGGGSSSGSGAVRVHMSGGESLDFSTPPSFDDLGALTPDEQELIMALYTKAQQDNKAAYKLLNEHAEQGIADLVVGDGSMWVTIMMIAMVRAIEAMYKEYMPDVQFDWGPFAVYIVATVPLSYSNQNTDVSGMDENSLALFEEVFTEDFLSVESEIVLYDPSDPSGAFSLKEDGSVLYESIPTEEPVQPYEPIIYLSGVNGMTEDLIEANKRAYLNALHEYIGVFWSVRENFTTLPGGSGYNEKGGCVHEIYIDISTTPSRKCFRYWNGTDMMQVTLDQDGNATLEVYASINPTATE